MRDSAIPAADHESVTSAGILRVSEIFESLQGEGINTGKPSTFLRLALCNLRCTWCDTKYTWDWAAFNYSDEVRSIPVAEVTASIRAKFPAHVVITGGEPLLQQKPLVPLITALKGTHTFEIETAGTIVPSSELIEQVQFWNVSPKLANSGNALSARFKLDALAVFASLPNAAFKFVVQNRSDLEELLAIVSDLSIPPERVLLMPEGTDPETLNRRCLDLVPICIQYRFRLSYRLHVALWGNKRGV